MKKLILAAILTICACGTEYPIAREWPCPTEKPLACYGVALTCCEADFPYYCEADGYCYKAIARGFGCNNAEMTPCVSQ